MAVAIPAIPNTWTPETIPADAYVELGSASQPIGSGSAKMLARYLNPSFVVNVRMLGATGNGTTNDGPAFDDAIGILRAAGGGALYLPKGVYYTTDQIWVNFSNCRIYGDGIGVSEIKVGAWVDGIRVASDDYPSVDAVLQNIEICHLSINGNRTAFSSPNDTNGNGINLNGVENFWVHHVRVYDSSQQGIVSTFFNPGGGYQYQSQASIHDCIVDMSCTIPQIGIGFEGHFGRAVAHGNRVKFTNSAGAGIAFTNIGEVNQDNSECVCVGNVLIGIAGIGYGIRAESSWHAITITGNVVRKFLSSIRADNEVGSDASGAVISSNHCREFSEYGILCSPGEGVERDTSITGNVLISSESGVVDAIGVADGASVTGNYIRVANGDGILAFDDAIIANNYIYTATGSSVDLTNAVSKTTLVQGNFMNAAVDGQLNGIVTGNFKIGEAYDSGSRIYNSVLAVGEKQIIVGNAPPSSGTWKQGDLMINQDATGVTFPGWQCVSNGTPGTWVPMAANQLAQSAATADSTASDVATLRADFNAFLARMRTAKLMAT